MQFSSAAMLSWNRSRPPLVIEGATQLLNWVENDIGRKSLGNRLTYRNWANRTKCVERNTSWEPDCHCIWQPYVDTKTTPCSRHFYILLKCGEGKWNVREIEVKMRTGRTIALWVTVMAFMVMIANLLDSIQQEISWQSTCSTEVVYREISSSLHKYIWRITVTICTSGRSV